MGRQIAIHRIDATPPNTTIRSTQASSTLYPAHAMPSSQRTSRGSSSRRTRRRRRHNEPHTTHAAHTRQQSSARHWSDTEDTSPVESRFLLSHDSLLCAHPRSLAGRARVPSEVHQSDSVDDPGPAAAPLLCSPLLAHSTRPSRSRRSHTNAAHTMSSAAYTSMEEIPKKVASTRAYFDTHVTKTAQWRKDQVRHGDTCDHATKRGEGACKHILSCVCCFFPL